MDPPLLVVTLECLRFEEEFQIGIIKKMGFTIFIKEENNPLAPSPEHPLVNSPNEPEPPYIWWDRNKN